MAKSSILWAEPAGGTDTKKLVPVSIVQRRSGTGTTQSATGTH